MEKRLEEIYKKGFDIIRGSRLQNENDKLFRKVRLGTRPFSDASIDISQYFDKVEQLNYRNKFFVLGALANNDFKTIRKISKFFYMTNGIYQKVVNYYASMYRYDWYMAAEPFTESVNNEKVITDFVKNLTYFDNSQIRKTCGEFSVQVIRDGVYYGYAYEGENSINIQELPIDYCRSKFKINGVPTVEFDMRFFDTKFPDINYRLKVLDLFPPEFKKGYMMYKKGQLPADNIQSNYKKGHWYLLDPECAFKFSIFGTNDLPLFINAIPAILDLEDIQGLDKKRQLQKLLKIIVQQLPRDKNGDLIFDIDEAADIHNNAVEMLQNAIGVDIITTFADIKAVDISDASTLAKDTTLDNAQRATYDAFGVSRNVFNTDGNLALEKSILRDEGSLRNLLYQYEYLYNKIAMRRSANKKKWTFKFYFLPTTQYNYQALSKLYKEQTQIGFSKMLPQIALGASQSFILNTAFFENSILNLTEIMLPPLMSSTLSAEDIQNLGNSNQQNQKKTDKSSGRPPKEEGELSEKTIQNKESAS